MSVKKIKFPAFLKCLQCTKTQNKQYFYWPVTNFSLSRVKNDNNIKHIKLKKVKDTSENVTNTKYMYKHINLI